MNKNINVALVLFLALSAAACGGGTTGADNAPSPPASVPSPPPPPPPGSPPATTATLTVTTPSGTAIVQAGQIGQFTIASAQEVRVVSSADVSWSVSMMDGTVPLTTQIQVDTRTWNARINNTAGRTLNLIANSQITPGLVVGTAQFVIQ
jgi:hypothetical protein